MHGLLSNPKPLCSSEEESSLGSTEKVQECRVKCQRDQEQWPGWKLKSTVKTHRLTRSAQEKGMCPARHRQRALTMPLNCLGIHSTATTHALVVSIFTEGQKEVKKSARLIYSKARIFFFNFHHQKRWREKASLPLCNTRHSSCRHCCDFECEMPCYGLTHQKT